MDRAHFLGIKLSEFIGQVLEKKANLDKVIERDGSASYIVFRFEFGIRIEKWQSKSGKPASSYLKIKMFTKAGESW